MENQPRLRSTRAARRPRRTSAFAPKSGIFASGIFAVVFAFATAFVFDVGAISAQTPSSSPSPSPPQPFPRTSDEVARSQEPASNEKTTFWLADSNGSWNIPLPNWTLEEVMKTIDAREEKTSEAPFSIQSVDAIGAIKDGFARLTIKFDVNVADGLVRVPLGLREGVYIPDPNRPDDSGFSFEGPGFCALDVDPRTGEYVVVVQTTPRKERRRSPRPTESASSPASAPASESESAAPTEPPQTAAPVPATTPAATPAPASGSAPSDKAPSDKAPSETPAEPTAFVAATRDRYADEKTGADSDESGADDPRELLSATRVRPNQFALTLELCFVVETFGADEYRLRASFPASVHSQMTLEAPISDAKIDVAKGAVATPPTSLSETSTELKFHGLGRGGETTEIAWRKDASQRLESRVVYQVEDASIDVRLDARETTYDATLPIRSFGGESDVFSIRLPERASLVADSVVATGANDEAIDIRGVRELDADADDAVSVADGATGAEKSASAGTGESAKTVEIRLARKTAAATLKLKARVQVAENVPNAGSATSSPTRKISGFNVVGAQKQYGRIKVEKSQELDFNVAPSYGARAGSDRATSLENGAEAYSFFSQPFLLNAQAFVRQIVVNVKPEYQTTISESDARLSARFQYSVYGAKISDVKIRLNGWILAGSNEEGVVDVARIYQNETTGETVFPLKTPSEGTVEFELTAARDLAATDGEFALPLPTPVADWVEPGPCVVVPTDAVELTPRPESFVGLTPKSLRSFSLSRELPKSQQAPTSYQTRQRFAKSDDGTPSTFAGRVEKLEQKIEIEAKTEVRVSEQGAKQIQQTFVYRIEREPLESLSIQTPLKLLEASNAHKLTNLKIFVDGKLVPPQNLQLETNDDKFARRRVLLTDAPKIGTCVVSVQYDGGTVELKPGMTSKIELNFMQPEDETLVSNELTIYAPPGVSLEYVENNARFWRLEETGRSPDGRSSFFRYRSATREFLAAFNGSLDAKDNLGVSIVDRAWIQTWISGDSRLDRVAYRVSTDRDRLEIRLPDGVRQERVAVSLDRVPFANVADAERGLFDANGTLVVPISEEARRRELTLEIAYSIDRAGVAQNRWVFEFPEFSGDSTWVRRAYWQILTPFNRCVVVDPSNWTPEYVVRRGAFGVYRRVASTTQKELCDWVGVPDRETIPPEVNAYLFSGFNQPKRSRLYVVDRAALVLIGSGAALAFGLGLIYFPFVRSRGVLFVAALAIATLAAFRPLLALLFLQTTVLGVALTLATALVAKFFGRKDAPPRPSPAPERRDQSALVGGERKKRSGGSSRVVAEKQ